MSRLVTVLTFTTCLLAAGAAGALAQSQSQAPPTTRPASKVQPPVAPPARPSPPSARTEPVAQAPSTTGDAPSEDSLGLLQGGIYPAARFLTSYDAGRGQRYYLFGTTASFADVVAYYKSVLKQRGELVFEEPATHMFDIGRFREESMAFPPSITIKDYTWGGSAGYPNPKAGAQPARFPTIIQIVPIPPGTSDAGRD